MSCLVKRCTFYWNCAQGEACRSGSCVQRCKNHENCELNESCCRYEARSGVCRRFCLGNRCENSQNFAPGEHCSGKYFKVCSNDRKCESEACDSKTETKSETGWGMAVGVVTFCCNCLFMRRLLFEKTKRLQGIKGIDTSKA